MNKGYTLIELLAVLFIICIISAAVFDFIYFNNEYFRKIDKKVDVQQNMRIAADYLYDLIIKAKSIEIEKDYFLIDEKRIYIKNNILRIDTDSQQIASNITKIEIEKTSKEKNLYLLTICSNDNMHKTYILNRCELYE